jgi:hypothetical protein
MRRERFLRIRPLRRLELFAGCGCLHRGCGWSKSVAVELYFAARGNLWPIQEPFAQGTVSSGAFCQTQNCPTFARWKLSSRSVRNAGNSTPRHQVIWTKCVELTSFRTSGTCRMGQAKRPTCSHCGAFFHPSTASRRQGTTDVPVSGLRRPRPPENRSGNGLVEGRTTAAEVGRLVRSWDSSTPN